jgi:hypothetical protein
MEPSTPLRVSVLAILPALRGKAWRPLTGGRTNRLWRVGDTVVKAYDPAAASPLFPNEPLAEARALAHLAPLGLGPALIGAAESWVAYRFTEGVPWRSDPAPVARLLHRLHAAPSPGFRSIPSGSGAILAQTRGILRDCKGGIGPAPTDPGIPPTVQPRLLHGDAVPGNIIDGPGGLTLIDWQCPASGDPAEDLATFLSPAMQWLYRGKVLSDGERSAFLASYPDPAVIARYLSLAPLFRWRMAAHCLWKWERGASDYAAALKLELA